MHQLPQSIGVAIIFTFFLNISPSLLLSIQSLNGGEQEEGDPNTDMLVGVVGWKVVEEFRSDREELRQS